jgi:hypothetical protein
VAPTAIAEVPAPAPTAAPVAAPALTVTVTPNEQQLLVPLKPGESPDPTEEAGQKIAEKASQKVNEDNRPTEETVEKVEKVADEVAETRGEVKIVVEEMKNVAGDTDKILTMLEDLNKKVTEIESGQAQAAIPVTPVEVVSTAVQSATAPAEATAVVSSAAAPVAAPTSIPVEAVHTATPGAEPTSLTPVAQTGIATAVPSAAAPAEATTVVPSATLVPAPVAQVEFTAVPSAATAPAEVTTTNPSATAVPAPVAQVGFATAQSVAAPVAASAIAEDAPTAHADATPIEAPTLDPVPPPALADAASTFAVLMQRMASGIKREIANVIEQHIDDIRREVNERQVAPLATTRRVYPIPESVRVLEDERIHREGGPEGERLEAKQRDTLTTGTESLRNADTLGESGRANTGSRKIASRHRRGRDMVLHKQTDAMPTDYGVDTGNVGRDDRGAHRDAGGDEVQETYSGDERDEDQRKEVRRRPELKDPESIGPEVENPFAHVKEKKQGNQGGEVTDVRSEYIEDQGRDVGRQSELESSESIGPDAESPTAQVKEQKQKHGSHGGETTDVRSEYSEDRQSNEVSPSGSASSETSVTPESDVVSPADQAPKEHTDFGRDRESVTDEDKSVTVIDEGSDSSLDSGAVARSADYAERLTRVVDGLENLRETMVE